MLRYLPFRRAVKLMQERGVYPATRDFTVDYCIRKKEGTLVPHTRVAKDWLQDMIDGGELSGPVVPDSRIVEVVHWLRREGFRVNS